MQQQSNLFASQNTAIPLAHRLRPDKLEDLVGTIKNNPAFIKWLESGAEQSALIWGPPGTGKTTIAHLAARNSNKEFIKLQAFSSGVKDLREIIARAEQLPNSIILFVDEVHNFNKNQQDILLNAIERGILVFVGATTENPAIAINRALLSRCIKFNLEALSLNDLCLLVDRAVAQEEISIDAEARDYLARSAHGDARNLLTNLDLVIKTTESHITLEEAQKIIQDQIFAGDDNSYYDCISALQKSLRGSDVNASLYWLARLLSGGAELKAVARRILVTAAEDVGIADPQALVITEAAYNAAINLGMPEARIALAQAVVYIAKAPKSNWAYKALECAYQDCYNHPPYPVPEHLRNIHVHDCPAKSNNSKVNPKTGYKYSHDYPGHWVEQQYLPDELVNKKYYTED